ncbi:MAG: carbon storage regulator CsrA [Zavarzinella sp.]
MLVLSRKKNESVVINNNVVVTIVEVRGDKVRLGIVAPRDVSVHRQEIYNAIYDVKLTDDAKATKPITATAQEDGESN